MGRPRQKNATAMPVLPQQPHPHREKIAAHGEEMLSFVARPVKPSEIATNPKARAAVEDEWKKLRAINKWLEGTVCEYDDVRTGALKKNVEVYFGRVFALCHEKHSEDPTKSKYKGRVVFQGNQVSARGRIGIVKARVRCLTRSWVKKQLVLLLRIFRL